jgi:calpain-15
MSIKEIEDEVRLTGEKYFDLDFPPRDTSVFETNIDARFDVVVHWRRPEEFLHANYELGTLKCVVFQDSCEPSDIKPGILRNEWFLSALAILAERPELVERLFVK